MFQPLQCLHRAQNSYRHFMVKLLDNGSFLIPGEERAHASLDALITFHQQQPMRPHGELLKQPCSQVRFGTRVGSSCLPRSQAPQIHFAPTGPLQSLVILSSQVPPTAPLLLVLVFPQANF